MGIEVVYPETYHETVGEYFDGKERFYIFTCPKCGYQRKQWLEPKRKPEILVPGDTTASHIGEAGICELMGVVGWLKTSMNDAAAGLMLKN